MTKKKEEAKQEETTQAAGAECQEENGQQAAAPEGAECQAEAPAPKDEMKELNDKYLRVLAEYDNYRKRSQKERESLYGDAQAAAVAQLLPVLDNLYLASQQKCADEEFKKGVDLIIKQFNETLEKMGVQEIEAQGKPFDPNLHDAVMHVENDDLPENTVAGVMRRGYVMGERVIRHAMVQVAN